MRAIVTGGTGFLGSYMCRDLVASGTEVTATYYPTSDVASGPLPRSVHAEPLDVRDHAAVASVLRRVEPDVVYHFAGQAFVIPSWEDPVGTFSTNTMGTLNLLEVIRRHLPNTRLAFAGSGTEYGAPDLIPTPEDSALRPTSPYASSKAAADLLCYQYFQSFGIRVFRYRIFGTTGVGKRGDSVNDFASQVARLERLSGPRRMKVGNLDTARDVSDVRDAVRAMRTVVEKGQPGDAYNIGSGTPRKVSETLRTLLLLARVPIETETESARVRLVDEPIHLADITRLRSLGWEPQIAFETTLHDVLDSWRTLSK
jgi:GDP-4-dehydro-6-deoxy-D-mannose reductase